MNNRLAHLPPLKRRLSPEEAAARIFKRPVCRVAPGSRLACSFEAGTIIVRSHLVTLVLKEDQKYIKASGKPIRILSTEHCIFRRSRVGVGTTLVKGGIVTYVVRPERLELCRQVAQVRHLSPVEKVRIFFLGV